MSTSTTNKEEYVKHYELESVIKTLTQLEQQTSAGNTEIKQLINDLRKEIKDSFVTKEKLALEINPIQTSLKTYNRVVWLIASALAPVLVLTFWQLVVNNSRSTQAVGQDTNNVRQN